MRTSIISQPLERWHPHGRTQIANALVQKSEVELWAGVECTVNRVGDQYFDQLKRNGHADRITDLDLFASLGVTAIRYPVLWERIAPGDLNQADWSWADQRLQRLRELDIEPIVGLVHHGSGPDHTSLIDPAFAQKLAEFAQAVATRYPWVRHYTPINEPLTTARFSGLYGHWYPHGQDPLTFVRALLNQCQAIVLSMQTIRQINPEARLIQTEDLGKVFSTPLLTYQADFENERRWLSFDLLCGRVDRTHSFWNELCGMGILESDLEWFLENSCPPDIFGINHYLTSDRFLDERLDRYPSQLHGGNGRHHYADVEAVRVCPEGIFGHHNLLKEVWERYGRSIALTEVHLGCTREEQLRWFKEAWDAADQLRKAGADIRAVTAWSLLGAYDWNTLLTQSEGSYEPGVFDLRSPTPRPTALAEMLRHLGNYQDYTHPVLQELGWWRRAQRLTYPRTQRVDKMHASENPIAITGATGTLGRAFARLCEMRGIPYRLLTRQDLDITQSESVTQVLADLKPWAVINTAGYVRVDDAEHHSHLCRQINTNGAALLAKACAEQDIAFVTFSSDLVFDGTHTAPYVESDRVAPLNVYGQSKAIAERWVLNLNARALVIRTSAFFGPWDDYNFLTIARRTLADGQPFFAAEDAVISPTYVPDLVNATLDLLIDQECGLWHLANLGAISWAEFARAIARLTGFEPSQVEACSTESLGLTAPRPTYTALTSERGILLPSLEGAIEQYLQACG
ncbi:dTDP-4-dehydrorhamnose reductase [Phormidesmis priestleyi ULC007]|uniref:dTDP-4-dehydrorhamnose reductase n=1 Tax=Phormidesmis priestleyi ULC007 TaxID=1920490 RepID=A0A2T1DAB0_9CYAN|nr:family 1 glycosylhydrolase [Phormidesmis priestleyi]PSB17442.1 dTDP-4-dehydrorhamnose reductase [Phormidesmis priestleyi ULC007]PZO48393.1 MAG: dTDP-4-dehydrorhamnose reductase [Phormidesmis priestleyi]